MRDIYKTLKTAVALQIFPKNNFSEFEQNFNNVFKKIYTANSLDEAKELITKHKNELDIIISDHEINIDTFGIEIEVLSHNITKLSEILVSISKKVEVSLHTKREAQSSKELAEALKAEEEKNAKLMKMLVVAKQKTNLFNFVVDELLVKFEISKDGIVSSTSKNFAEIFGFREEYIINEDILKIVYGSVLQKTLLNVTREKKPLVEYITFNTKTGVIIEPYVAIVPHFDNTGYLDTYTLYCSLQ